jgi:uncharacterized protein
MSRLCPQRFTMHVIGSIALGTLVSSSALSQSFDCAKAVSVVEHTICADKGLAALDGRLATDLHSLILAQPNRRAALLSGERLWLRERDQHCGVQSTTQRAQECLTAAYSARIAEIARGTEGGADQHAKTSSCQKIVERYHPLANAHPGEAPLEVLAKSPTSGFKLAPWADLVQMSATDLPAWAAAQKPPFSISPALLNALKEYDEVGSVGALLKAPGANFYSISRTSGSMGCSDSQSFILQGRTAVPTETPGESNGDGECGIGAQYGTLDNSPVAIVQDYNWRPGMTASLEVWGWTEQGFSDECEVYLTYKPRFTEKTLNTWGETCEANNCDELRSAAFKLAEAAEADPQALQDSSVESLTPKQKEQYDAMVQFFGTQSRDPSSNDPFTIPFFTHDHQYLASIGHYAIGWRDYADYSVLFEEIENGKLIRRGAFSVGTWKGDLDGVTVTGR